MPLLTKFIACTGRRGSAGSPTMLAIVLFGLWVVTPATPLQAQRNVTERLQALERDNSALRTQVAALESRIRESANTAETSVSQMKSMFDVHLTTLRNMYGFAAGLLSVAGGLGVVLGFFGVKGWADVARRIERIKKAEADIAASEAKLQQADLIEKARYYISCDQNELALESLEKASAMPLPSLQTDRFVLLLNRAVCLKRTQRHAEAYRLAREAADKWDFAQAWYNAACYASLASARDPGYKSSAIECLTRAHKLSPGYTRSVALGRVEFDDGADREHPDPDLKNIWEMPEFKTLLPT